MMSFQDGGPSGLKCDRFAGDLLEDTHLMRLFVSKFMSHDFKTMAACIYFHSHRFSLIKVKDKAVSGVCFVYPFVCTQHSYRYETFIFFRQRIACAWLIQEFSLMRQLMEKSG